MKNNAFKKQIKESQNSTDLKKINKKSAGMLRRGCQSQRHVVNLDVTDGRLHILTCHNSLGCVLCKCSPRRSLASSASPGRQERPRKSLKKKKTQINLLRSIYLHSSTRGKRQDSPLRRLQRGIHGGPRVSRGKSAEDAVCGGSRLLLAQKRKKTGPAAAWQLA